MKRNIILSLVVMMTVCLMTCCSKDEEERPVSVKFYDKEIPYREIDRNSAPGFLTYLMESGDVSSIYQANLNGKTIYAYLSTASLFLSLPRPFYLDENGNSIGIDDTGYEIYEKATDWVCIFWNSDMREY